jgi:hypothetical protein
MVRHNAKQIKVMRVMLDKLELEWFKNSDFSKKIVKVEPTNNKEAFWAYFAEDVNASEIFIYGRMYQLSKN